MATEMQVACRDVRRHDAIRPSRVPAWSESDLLANVLDVTVIGANVRIETDIGGTEILPGNRSITVWRPTDDQETLSGT